MIKKFVKKIYDEFKDFYDELDIICKYLIPLGILYFFVVCISVFNSGLDEKEHFVTIRLIFSSISGYILEKSTKTCTSNPKLLKNKILLVGSFSVISTIVIILACIVDVSVDNQSLLLIKNLLFSSIGFLTSASNTFFKKDN